MSDKTFEATLDVITETLKTGEKVQISGFGVFELKEKGERENNYSQFFGILGKSTIFFEDKEPHNGKRVCTIVKLGTEPCVLTNINENHEAYRRVIYPAIEGIENLLTYNCIDHAPVADENADEM